MNIAIVGPSPVPFVVGGVENLLWGLQQTLNQKTEHHAELIKLPSRERSFWELLDTYETFFRLDLSHFDMVLTTKYPAWMIQHPNHVAYVQHRLRGLYDTYHFCGEPTAYESSIPAVKRVLDLIGNPSVRGRDGIERVFAALHELRAAAASIPQDVFRFPGPFIRKILHFLDDRAMADGAIKRFYAISQTVADRKEYFPAGAPVTVVHHPSFLAEHPRGRYRYLFTASRLDGPKRIGLIVEAMRHVPHDVGLKIVGTGPLEAELRALAGDDPRIEFLGFVNDEGLAELYADALAVPYVPYQEDFGLITIEGMRCAKPILTVCDSGGPNEFVVDDETGYSVLPEPKALAEKINYLVENPGAAERMGRNAAQRVAGITWENTVGTLLAEPRKPRAETEATAVVRQKRPKVVVTSTFSVYPPLGGGQNRIYYLYRALAKHYDVEIVSVVPADEKPFRGEIGPSMIETRVPKSQRHQLEESDLERQAGMPVTDVAMPRLISLTPAYAEALSRALIGAHAVVASHPYLVPVIEKLRGDVPLVYEAHNVEADLKEHVLGGTKAGRELIALTRQIEAEAFRKASLLVTCAEADERRLCALYGALASRSAVVPNGVELSTVPYMPPAEREKGLAISKSATPTVLFMGSWHPPNLEAAEHVLRFARQLPQVAFFLIGSQCQAFEGRSLPTNVARIGLVDDDMKAFLLHRASLALNPMTSGSGTNLKMLDYFAAGIPVVSTPFGGRGLGAEHGQSLYVSDISGFPAAIRELLADSELRGRLASNARALAEESFDWEVIAERFAEALGSQLDSVVALA